jgi:hypothetical protein
MQPPLIPFRPSFSGFYRGWRLHLAVMRSVTLSLNVNFIMTAFLSALRQDG